ncbi:MAG: hypothetical protein ACFE9N_14665 [Promethearchaeota archaeon]
MVENVIKTFKLNYDGTFDEVAYEHIKEVFTIVNILAIYITKIKTMYIWIGKNATQALKNHIPNIRVILKEEFPLFRIIRNITFDMRSEPFEFFNNLNLSKDELYEIINYQEKTVLPILEKVDDLKAKSENLIQSEEYKNAIDLLKEIIELAIKIEDDALITEQKSLISTLTEKFENQQIVSEIEEETTKIEKEYNELIRSERILDAHKLIDKFVKNYEAIYDLTLIPSAKELIIKEKRKWYSEQEKIKNDLLRIEKELKPLIDNLDLPKATEVYEKGLGLLSNLIDDEIKNRWVKFKQNIEEAYKRLDFIEKFDNFSEKINTLKENHQYMEIKSRSKELLKETEKIDVPEYRSKLELLTSEIESAEQLFKKMNKEIVELEISIKKNRKNALLNEVLADCEKIIDLAITLKKSDLIENYTQILESTKKEIKERKEFEEKQAKIKDELSKLEKRFTLLLKNMEINKLNDLLEKGDIFLGELVDDDEKEKWDDYKQKFISAQQLLENIEELSKNGIEALNKGSCSGSLEFFEQIILQIQEYKN